jgi:hypothetical protein
VQCDVLVLLALAETATEKVLAAVGLDLPGSDHPRQRGPHRAARDPELGAQSDERPGGEPRRVTSQQGRQRQGSSGERFQPEIGQRSATHPTARAPPLGCRHTGLRASSRFFLQFLFSMIN